MNLVPRPW